MASDQNVVVRAFGNKWMRVAVGLLAAVMIIWDIPLAKDDITGNTWSELLRIAGEKSVVVPWCLGLVMGHWFHPNDDLQPAIPAPYNAWVLIGASVGVWWLGKAIDIPMWLVAVVAAPVGAWLWPVTTNPQLPEALGRTRS